MLSGVGPLACQALWKIFVAFPSIRPLLDRHHLGGVNGRIGASARSHSIAFADGRIDLNGISTHELVPFHAMHARRRRRRDDRLDLSAEIATVHKRLTHRSDDSTILLSIDVTELLNSQKALSGSVSEP